MEKYNVGRGLGCEYGLSESANKPTEPVVPLSEVLELLQAQEMWHIPPSILGVKKAFSGDMIDLQVTIAMFKQKYGT